MKNFNILILIFFTLYSCGGFKDAGKVLRNEKIKTTDEFLVKKKEPLVLPPDYNKIPEPGSMKEKNSKNEGDKIKEILKIKENNNSENVGNGSDLLNNMKKKIQ